MKEQLMSTNPYTLSDDIRPRSGYCQHGTYVGLPGGADLMCGYCESGDESNMEKTYEVLTVQRWAGGDCYTVIETVDGQSMGGDHHWLLEINAQRAAETYRAGLCEHGATLSSMVLSVWAAAFGNVPA